MPCKSYGLRQAVVCLLICEQRIILHCVVDFLTNAGDYLLVFWRVEYFLDKLCYESHHVFLGTTCGHGGCTKAYAACLECATAVERYHVLVDGDVSSNECVLCNLTCEVWILAA